MTDAHPSLRRRDDLVFRQLDDEWVVFDSATNKLHTLNLTAALVWTELTGDAGEEDIVTAVAEAFGRPATVDEVRDDIRAAIQRFRDEGLLA